MKRIVIAVAAVCLLAISAESASAQVVVRSRQFGPGFRSRTVVVNRGFDGAGFRVGGFNQFAAVRVRSFGVTPFVGFRQQFVAPVFAPAFAAPAFAAPVVVDSCGFGACGFASPFIGFSSFRTRAFVGF